MNSGVFERLREMRLPAATEIPAGCHVVARLRGVDFEGLLDSPELGFSQPVDARYAKLMVRTISYLLGGDACGRFGFVELLESSVLLDSDLLRNRWTDANDVQNFLVALASTRLSALMETETLFNCQLFAFTTPALAVNYFMWRQQEANLAALDRYCGGILAASNSPAEVAMLLERLAPREKEEILRQHDIEYASVPGWLRAGIGVMLQPDGRVSIEAALPHEGEYAPYIERFLEREP